MVTLREIAEIAGVSVGTVSRVLNNLDRVNPETRRRVQEVIDKVGYEPNRSAVSLAKRGGRTPRKGRKRPKAMHIGFLFWERYVPKISLEPVYAGVMEGAQRYFQDLQDHFHVRVIPEDFTQESQAPLILRDNLDGFILLGEIPDPMIRYIEQHRIPAVHFGSSPEYVANSTIVMPDNFNGAYQAVTHLISLGHQRIAFVSPNKRKVSLTERMRGYVAALIESGVALKDKYYRYAGQGELGGAEAVAMFRKSAEPPTAIFCATDAAAFAVLKYCSDQGIGVPDQLSVVGFDDTSYAEYSIPALTTVRQPMLQAGRVAAAELLEAISHPEPIPKKIVLSTKLVVRASTAPPAKPR